MPSSCRAAARSPRPRPRGSRAAAAALQRQLARDAAAASRGWLASAPAAPDLARTSVQNPDACARESTLGLSVKAALVRGLLAVLTTGPGAIRADRALRNHQLVQGSHLLEAACDRGRRHVDRFMLGRRHPLLSHRRGRGCAAARASRPRLGGPRPRRAGATPNSVHELVRCAGRGAAVEEVLHDVRVCPDDGRT